MGMREGPASRDSQFRGIDTDALAQLIRQVQTATSAIDGWLAAHPPPAGISSAGYQKAATVERWASEQLGMLTRRRNYALTHRDQPTVDSPASPVVAKPVPKQTPKPVPKPKFPREKSKPRHLVPIGAGEIGGFPTSKAAEKAAASDALAIRTAQHNHRPVPDDVWTHLAAHSHDPEYTAALYQRLGPEGVAQLIKAAGTSKAELKAIIESVTAADHLLHMDGKWIAALLAEADRLNNRGHVLQVLGATPLAPKLAAATSLNADRLTDTVKAS
ncbi:MAG: hypothetical protein ABIS86_22875 [Streptosporangiaceae bacterium]